MEIRHQKYRKPADQHIFIEWSIKNKFIKVKTNTPARKIAWTGRTLKSQAKRDYRRTVYSNAIFVWRVQSYVPATSPTKNRGVTRSSRSNQQWMELCELHMCVMTLQTTGAISSKPLSITHERRCLTHPQEKVLLE